MNKKEEPLVSRVIGVALIVMAAFSLLIFFDNLPRFLSSGYAIGTPSEAVQKESVGEAPAFYDTSTQPEYASNEFLIKLSPNAKGLLKSDMTPQDIGIDSLNALNTQHGAVKFEQVAKENDNSKKDSAVFSWYKVTLAGPGEVIKDGSAQAGNHSAVMSSYKSDNNVVAVEPNYVVKVVAAPNDPYYSSSGSWGQLYPDLWGIRKIDAEPAWDQTTGSASIIVASIDTGVDRNHPDLAANMWVNTGEKPGNGKDDDHNGYVDDYYGRNWVNYPYNNPMDDHGHGTHTAGTIAAVGNNGLGVVGVNWNVRIMALKFLDSSGSGYLSDGIAALQYAADMGARVSSNSWGCSCNSQAMDDAIKYEHDKGMITVVAAGNNNGDALSFSPASADDAITVAASDPNDLKAYFSNWGEKIDVAAPGVDILSLKAAVSPMCTDAITVGTNYCRVSGTSMATPHVAGLAALILSKNPSLTNEEVRQIIRQGAADLGTPGKDASFGYGRISAPGSLNLAATHPLTPYITSPRSRSLFNFDVINVVGSIPGPNFASYKVEVGLGRSPATWTTITTSTTQVIGGTLATFNATKLAGSDLFNFIIRLTAFDKSGQPYVFQVNDVTVDRIPPTVNMAMPAITTAARSSTLILQASATDNNQDALFSIGLIAKVEFYGNNALLCTATGWFFSRSCNCVAYGCYWKMSNSPKKTYQIVAKAYDLAGNTATSTSVTVISQ